MTKQPEFQPFWFQQAMALEADYRNNVQPQTLNADTVADVCILGGSRTSKKKTMKVTEHTTRMD